MAIWEWTLAAYGKPGTPQATLVLQDEHGQNTSYLLWAAWAGVSDPALLGRGAALARTWGATALEPLREVRRALKPAFPGVQDAARERLREAVKAAELDAERILMESLEALAGRSTTPAPSLEVLRAAVRAWGAPAADEALVALAAALG